jgi:hypothetical protein
VAVLEVFALAQSVLHTKPEKHSAKCLPSVLLGKESSTNCTSATTSLNNWMVNLRSCLVSMVLEDSGLFLKSVVTCAK